MTEAQSATVARVRKVLAAVGVQEKRMFGTVAFMVNGAMLLAVDRDGGLLARVLPERDAELLTRPHATRSEMGAGRSMGVGWIRVEAAGIETEAGLREWVDETLRRLDTSGNRRSG